MATAAPTSTPPNASANDVESQRRLYRNIALGTVIVCPVIALLPPRKLDLYTGLLGATTIIAGNHLARDSTGMSLVQLMQYKLTRAATAEPSDGLPTERARAVKRLLKEQKDAEIAAQIAEAKKNAKDGEETVKALLAKKAEEEEKKRGVLSKLWMGSESQNWKEERDQREKEALEEGKGYGDLIMEQISEVWNGGKKKDEEEPKDGGKS